MFSTSSTPVASPVMLSVPARDVRRIIASLIDSAWQAVDCQMWITATDKVDRAMAYSILPAMNAFRGDEICNLLEAVEKGRARMGCDE